MKRRLVGLGLCVVMMFAQECFAWAEENFDTEMIFYDSEIISEDSSLDEADASVGYVPSDIQEEEVSEESIEDYLIIDEIIEIPESDDNELQKEWQQTETVYDDEEELIEVLDDGEEEETLERNAYVDSSTKFEYTLSGNEAVITGYSGSSSVITIPTSVSGYKVTGIGSYAFENSTMTTLTIPSTITSIGYRAFFNCQKLSFINFNALNCNNSDGNGDTFYNAGQSAASLTVTFGNGVKRILSDGTLWEVLTAL